MKGGLRTSREHIATVSARSVTEAFACDVVRRFDRLEGVSGGGTVIGTGSAASLVPER